MKILLPPNLYRRVDHKTVLPRLTVIGQHMDAPPVRFMQHPGKFRMGLPIRLKIPDALHLHDEDCPGLVGASGNMAIPSRSSVTPFTSMKALRFGVEKARSKRELP